MPNPSWTTGPKPKMRSDGLPQFDVESTTWFSVLYPWSLKNSGIFSPRAPCCLRHKASSE